MPNTRDGVNVAVNTRIADAVAVRVVAAAKHEIVDERDERRILHDKEVLRRLKRSYNVAHAAPKQRALLIRPQ